MRGSAATVATVVLCQQVSNADKSMWHAPIKQAGDGALAGIPTGSDEVS